MEVSGGFMWRHQSKRGLKTDACKPLMLLFVKKKKTIYSFPTF